MPKIEFNLNNCKIIKNKTKASVHGVSLYIILLGIIRIAGRTIIFINVRMCACSGCSRHVFIVIITLRVISQDPSRTQRVRYSFEAVFYFEYTSDRHPGAAESFDYWQPAREKKNQQCQEFNK